jgi:ubiquinone/menaquinone biosynthesis C-methylase UbiE
MERSTEREMMDAADNPPALLEDDLKNLRLLNRYLGGARALRRGFAPLLARWAGTRRRILDVGAGSGDLAADIKQFCGQRGVAVEIVSIDRDPVAIALAARRNHAVSSIRALRADAAALPFAPRSFDCVMASQFLHHFSAAQITMLLRAWARLAPHAIVVSDLVRHPLAYYGIRALTAACTRNVMTRTDAPLSVRRACTLNEWRDIFQSADVGSVTVQPLMPFRMAARIEVER